MYTMPKYDNWAPWRPDKICLSKQKESQGFKIDATNIKRLGHFCIAPYLEDQVTDIAIDSIVRTPSDHYGL